MATWNLDDQYLADMLNQFVGWLGAQPDMFLCLYSNNYTPGIGTVLGDFTEATFAGYSRQNFPGSYLGSPTVTSHVAISTSSTVLTFDGDPGTWSPQTIYGYFVITNAGNYFWSERFATPIDMSPDGEIRITPRLLHENVA